MTAVTTMLKLLTVFFLAIDLLVLATEAIIGEPALTKLGSILLGDSLHT